MGTSERSNCQVAGKQLERNGVGTRVGLIEPSRAADESAVREVWPDT